MIPGFIASVTMSAAQGPRLVLIDRTSGSNFGDMTPSGAAFDGVTNQTWVNSALSTNSNNNCFIGKTLSAPRVIGRVVTYGASDLGYRTTAGNITLYLYGKNGTAPTLSLPGTLLGSTSTFANINATNAQTIDSSDLISTWRHVCVVIAKPASSPAGIMAELQMYAWE